MHTGTKTAPTDCKTRTGSSIPTSPTRVSSFSASFQSSIGSSTVPAAIHHHESLSIPYTAFVRGNAQRRLWLLADLGLTFNVACESGSRALTDSEGDCAEREVCELVDHLLRTRRSQTQETALSGQFAPGMRSLVFDFAVYASRVSAARAPL
eukprot:31116-Rhodomonas_salina.1